MKKTAGVVLLLAVCTLVTVIGVTYPWLPDRVASHFTADGRPNGWSSRSAYVVSLLAISTFTIASCTLPLLLSRHLPDSLINIPNREYWLAPQRREESLRRLSSLGIWIGTLCVGLFLGLHLLTVQANRRRPPRLPAAEGLGLTALFLLAVSVVIYIYAYRVWRVDSRQE